MAKIQDRSRPPAGEEHRPLSALPAGHTSRRAAEHEAARELPQLLGAAADLASSVLDRLDPAHPANNEAARTVKLLERARELVERLLDAGLPARDESDVPAPEDGYSSTEVKKLRPAALRRNAPPAGETILLVDDEKHLRQMAKRLLEGLGYRVILAASSDEAVALYEEQGPRIDLVLLDVILGAEHGAETLQRLQSIDREVRVLLSSGYSEPRDLLRQGACGFIQKPYGIDEMHHAIRLALKKS